MASKEQLDKTYMQTALLHAELSYGIRLKVGAVFVTRTGIIIPGVNGLPSALGNQLEYVDDNGEYVTKPAVIHAEQAGMNKAAKEGYSLEGSIGYITHAPCEHCASNIVAVGCKEIVWLNAYRNTKGLDILTQAGIMHRNLIL